MLRGLRRSQRLWFYSCFIFINIILLHTKYYFTLFPEFIARLFNEPRQSAVIEILLSHLPLLRPGNELAKNQYLRILPNVLSYAVERSEFLEEVSLIIILYSKCIS